MFKHERSEVTLCVVLFNAEEQARTQSNAEGVLRLEGREVAVRVMLFFSEEKNNQLIFLNHQAMQMEGHSLLHSSFEMPFHLHRLMIQKDKVLFPNAPCYSPTKPQSTRSI